MTDALTLTAPIEKDGAFATFVTVTGSVEHFGTGRPVKVEASADGHSFEATLMPSGAGVHWLPLRAAVCEAIGKRSAGETVEISVRRR